MQAVKQFLLTLGLDLTVMLLTYSSSPFSFLSLFLFGNFHVKIHC